MKSRQVNDYLRAKEALTISAQLGYLAEHSYVDDDKMMLENAALLLSNMFYDDFVELKEEFEPEGIAFTEGMRWRS